MAVGDEVVGAIGPGFLLLVGVDRGDTNDDVAVAARKVAGLRVFPDENGQMNRSILDAGGSALVVSQFTLLGDVRKGRRPSFIGAAPPEDAAPLVEEMIRLLEEEGVTVESGRFAAQMQVHLVNDGPVTILLEVKDGKVL